MGKFIDLTGQKFGRLTVVERVKNDNSGHVQWLCQCECGQIKIIYGGSLKVGCTKSCGCLHKEIITKHGYSGSKKRSRIYITWIQMIQRCTNPKNPGYKHYGGRGIKICEAWLSFENFLEDMGERPPNLTLDRVDNHGDYCKENCKWSTNKEQHRNTRQNRLITINGVTKCLAEWCEIYHKSYEKIRQRINRYGWTPEEALELMPRQRTKKNR